MKEAFEAWLESLSEGWWDDAADGGEILDSLEEAFKARVGSSRQGHRDGSPVMSKFNRKKPALTVQAGETPPPYEVVQEMTRMNMTDYLNDVRPRLLRPEWTTGIDVIDDVVEKAVAEKIREAEPVPAFSCARCGREVERGSDGDWYDTDHRAPGGTWQCSAHPDGDGHEVPGAPEPESPVVPIPIAESGPLAWALSPSIFGTAMPSAYSGSISISLITPTGVASEITLPLTPGANYEEHFTDPVTITGVRIRG